MIINRNSGNTQFVRTNLTKQAQGGSFGEALNNASSAKDSFSSSSAVGTSETFFNKSTMSSVPITQAKLDKISAAINDTDYSKMTKAEIYADIEGKYVDAFDDFYATLAFSACKDHEIIHDQFVNDVHNYVGYLKNTVREARGYSDMSFDEIEAAIKEKYIGKTGFMDQLNLFGELFSSGVLSNKYGREEANNMAVRLGMSVECRGEGIIPKNEWLERIEQTGASSPFSLLINNPYLANMKEIYETMVDDILFGIGA